MKKKHAIVKAKKKKAGKPKAKPKTEAPPILVNFILDKSGSMQSVKEETINGFNVYLDQLKKDKKSQYLFTLTLFDTASVDMLYVAAPLKDVKPLDANSYKPNAMTPLYDAVGNTIKMVEKNENTKKVSAVLTVIMTDGHENASHEFNGASIKALIQEKEATGTWTFVFLGADMNAWDAASAMGIPTANASPYSKSKMGQTMRAAAGATRSYSNTMNYGSDAEKYAMHVNFVKSANLNVDDGVATDTTTATTTAVPDPVPADADVDPDKA